MERLKKSLALAMAYVMVLPVNSFGSNHREAPITALDHKADITDVYAFVSYDSASGPSRQPTKATFILCVDPLLDPANGPTWFPFDPDILYEIKIDNTNDAVEDLVFQFRFNTEQRLPNLPQAMAGAGAGVKAPDNSPAPVKPGTLIIPPQINSFDSPGLGQRQNYTITMVQGNKVVPLTPSSPLYVVPANPGPQTMDYMALYNAGTYTLSNGIKVFAGTVDDPFWIDLGGTFDTINLRKPIAPGILSDAQDSANVNIAADTVSGYAVNAIAIEVPIEMLTRTGNLEPADSTAATIGVWGSTSRPRTTVRRAPLTATSSNDWSQIQRMGNPLINEVLIGNGFKDRFSMDQPKNDSQFADFFLDPTLARILNAATGGVLSIPPPPRTDLLPLVVYAPPIAAPGTPSGPVADMLRLNLGVPPTPEAKMSRLGLLGGDAAGYPNGRRLQDDVVDISLRAVAGVLNPAFNKFPNNRLGDGVNINDANYMKTFPYLAPCPPGRDRRHIDPGEPGCTAGAGAACAQ